MRVPALWFKQTPYEERRWNAAEAAWRGENVYAARLFREAAALAPFVEGQV